jgi:hypothetical protein
MGGCGGARTASRGTLLLGRGRHFHLVVVYTPAAFGFVRRNHDALFENRAAFHLLTYFMIESGSDGFSQHF